MITPLRLLVRPVCVLVAVLAMAGCTSSRASGPSGATVASAAPAMEVDVWLRGDAVTRFEPGHIYVVEQWATWCEPCRAIAPRLARLQADTAERGVHVLALSDEDADTVREYLEDPKLGRHALTYGVDTHDTLSDDWRGDLEFAVPRVWIVDGQGRIAFVGHSAQAPAVVEGLLDGTWDAETWARVEPLFDKLDRARKSERDGRILKVLAEIAEADPNRLLWAERQAIQLHLASAERVDEGFTHLEGWLERAWHDANHLNALAWFLVTKSDLPRRDLPLALRVAERANELETRPDYVDTLARVHFELGDLPMAIALQRRALDMAEADPVIHDPRSLRETLARYAAAADDALSSSSSPFDEDDDDELDDK